MPGSPFAVGGSGTGHPDASQGSLQLSADGRYLLAVDAGSNQISVLRIKPDGSLAGRRRARRSPRTASTRSASASTATSSTSRTPAPAASTGDTNYTGFTLDRGGHLRADSRTRPTCCRTTPSRARCSSTATAPSSSAPASRRSEIDSFTVGHGGRLTPAAGSPFDAQAFSPAAGLGPARQRVQPDEPESAVRLRRPHRRRRRRLPGLVSSFTDAADGTLTPVGAPVANDGGASCWVEISHDGRFLFVVNTASASISSYSIGAGGTLTFLQSTGPGADRRRRRGRTALPRRLDPLGRRVRRQRGHRLLGQRRHAHAAHLGTPARPAQRPPASSSTDARLPARWGGRCAAPPHRVAGPLVDAPSARPYASQMVFAKNLGGRDEFVPSRRSGQEGDSRVESVTAPPRRSHSSPSRQQSALLTGLGRTSEHEAVNGQETPGLAFVNRDADVFSAKGKGDGDSPLSYADQMAELNAYPADSITAHELRGARSAAIALKKKGPGKKNSTTSWLSLGPQQAIYPAITSRSGRPYVASGRITALAIKPGCKPEKCTVWAGAAGGGIWRTEDGLSGNPHWTNVSDGFFATGAIGSLLYDAPSHTLYAGTGELAGAIDTEGGFGIYKSTDDGKTWTELGDNSVFAYRAIRQIAIDPHNPNVIYVADGRGVHGISATERRRVAGPGGHRPRASQVDGRRPDLLGRRTGHQRQHLQRAARVHRRGVRSDARRRDLRVVVRPGRLSLDRQRSDVDADPRVRRHLHERRPQRVRARGAADRRHAHVPDRGRQCPPTDAAGTSPRATSPTAASSSPTASSPARRRSTTRRATA